MAWSSAVLRKHRTNPIFHPKSFIANQTNVLQAFSIRKKEMTTSGPCKRAAMLSGWPYTVSTKRKLCWVTVAGLGRRSCDAAGKTSHPYEQLWLPQKHHDCENRCVEDSSLVSSVHCKENNAFAYVCNSDSGLMNIMNRLRTQCDSWMKSLISHSDHSYCQDKKTSLVSSKLLLQCRNVRHFSRRRRHVDQSDQDEDDEEKKRRLRGAVMYVSNPLTWISKQWNMAKLKHSMDPSFSEDEFLVGARQAVSHVSRMVSTGKFDDLSGLVIEEVIDWLMSFRNSLAAIEREALALTVDDVVLMKIRYLHMDNEPPEDKPVAFVDSVCFGLRMCDRVPYFVDLGIRFKRDYSTDPPGDWIVAGVSHIRLQNLSTD